MMLKMVLFRRLIFRQIGTSRPFDDFVLLNRTIWWILVSVIFNAVISVGSTNSSCIALTLSLLSCLTMAKDSVLKIVEADDHYCDII